MADQSVVLRKVPKAAMAAIAACIFGFVYSFSFGSLLEAQHWYSFSASSDLTPEEYSTAVTFISISLFVYYTMYLVAAALLILRSRKYMMMTLLIMSGARLVSLLLMFRPGFQMVFQFGFEAALEILAFLCTAYIYKNVGKNKKLYDSRITVCVLGVLAESVPLLRNFQFLFLEGPNITAKISAVLLPVSVAVFIITIALRSAGFKRLVVFDSADNEEDSSENESANENEEHDEESGDNNEDDEFDADNIEDDENSDSETETDNTEESSAAADNSNTADTEKNSAENDTENDTENKKAPTAKTVKVRVREKT